MQCCWGAIRYAVLKSTLRATPGVQPDPCATRYALHLLLESNRSSLVYIYIYIYIYISITKLPNDGFGRERLGRASDELFSLKGALRTRFSRPRALSDALCASGGRPKRVRALPGAILLRFWLARTAPGAPRASIFLDFRAVFRGFS